VRPDNPADPSVLGPEEPHQAPTLGAIEEPSAALATEPALVTQQATQQASEQAVEEAAGDSSIDGAQEDPPRGAIAEWTITIILLLFLTTTLVQAFVIPTGSMEDTLLIGDHLLVDKLAYAPAGPVSKYILPYTEVKRGDIIVFRYPVDIKQTFVKRCMGVPGDRIKLVNKQVYLNGVPLQEPYKVHKTDYIDSYRDNFPGEPNVPVDRFAIDMLQNHVVNGEVVVPPNSYFAMGDNRDSSLDSRYWGFVPRENIIGKPLIIYWSYDASTEDLNNSSVSLKHILDLAENFFPKTRWRRAFMLVHGYPVK
jgi:signal peptidase I